LCPTRRDPIKDFAPIVLITNVPFVLVIHPSLPVSSVADLVPLREGTSWSIVLCVVRIASEYLKSLAGIEMTPVPYKCNMPALTDVVAGTCN
jgi:tripartite-type tricarboxylate transporter receptor subunit TctC